MIGYRSQIRYRPTGVRISLRKQILECPCTHARAPCHTACCAHQHLRALGTPTPLTPVRGRPPLHLPCSRCDRDPASRAAPDPRGSCDPLGSCYSRCARVCTWGHPGHPEHPTFPRPPMPPRAAAPHQSLLKQRHATQPGSACHSKSSSPPAATGSSPPNHPSRRHRRSARSRLLALGDRRLDDHLGAVRQQRRLAVGARQLDNVRRRPARDDAVGRHVEEVAEKHVVQ